MRQVNRTQKKLIEILEKIDGDFTQAYNSTSLSENVRKITLAFLNIESKFVRTVLELSLDYNIRWSGDYGGHIPALWASNSFGFRTASGRNISNFKFDLEPDGQTSTGDVYLSGYYKIEKMSYDRRRAKTVKRGMWKKGDPYEVEKDIRDGVEEMIIDGRLSDPELVNALKILYRHFPRY